ncbi:uncharacterized protein CIMG_00561 [Coccidioides immitis RS]|uniref:Uncharacterized protein n=2 Tax=Coccidioides TaxID=5500 RepID=J3KH94_COCIM|nr:uncharacterized protein CIMG_00561 [Coccidioides immitis RS]EAS35207.3 hypothetical protein CIMG_00561 [Coccidioides immitis RS]EFW13584.1 conserved hypothetical protein [Coccidioides posadasii str. Silveira]TPX26503.1 hypothetical protein DIZ76_011965 [Coccidioides immitis]
MAVPVGPRVSKEDFMHALGLDTNNPQHDPLYRAMRDEAIAVYNQMNQDNSNLLDNLRSNPEIRPPFFWHHIRPDRQQWGIMEIWRRAGPVTRPLFDRGDTRGEYGPNWVTGWLLYSVFRSRDIRNNRNRRKNDDNGSGNNSGQGQSKGTKGATTGTETQTRTTGYYDPVRNGAR